MKTEALNLRINKELKRRIKDAAEKEHRTMSNLVEKVMIDWLHKKIGKGDA